MKEQLAKMTIIELVRTAHNYSTSIKQTGVYSELVREIASRLEALNLAHIGAMAALQKRRSADAQEPVAVTTVSFYRDGVVAAAAWVDAQREAYDSEHGRHDPDTGAFEFENDAQQEYSTTLAEVADGIRALHPNTTQPAAVPDDKQLRALFDAWFASDCSFDRSPDAIEEDNIAWRESYWYVWQCCRSALQPSSGALQLVGEVVAWNHPNHERNVDFRWLDFNLDPGTKLYAIKQERS